MKPSQEAIEAAYKLERKSERWDHDHRIYIGMVLEAAYAIDVAPLEKALDVAYRSNTEMEARIRELQAEVADGERWLREVLTDYRIPFDDHKVGRRLAIVNWMFHRQ